ncbi:MAG: beta-lactamase [Myxococcaceae bacterium]|nr:beta-lactamase [Myxococcaceae bacterium]
MMRRSSWVLSTMGALACACGGDDSAPNVLDDTTIVYPVPDWQTVAPARIGFDDKALTKLATTADGNDSHCLVVTRKGRLVGEWYWDDWTRDTEAPVFSVTKSFTSTLVGIAQDQGMLDISDPASDYISEWQGSDSSDVTIKNLLSNDSGREWTFLKDYLEMAGTASDKTGYAIALGQDHPPGSFWEYNNSAIQTLERVLKQATGVEDVATFAHDKLLQPIGMSSTMGHDQAGNTEMFQDLKASCRDLARFGYLFLRAGKWGNRQIVSKAWVKQATSQSTPLNAEYGLLWWLNKAGHYVRPSSPSRVEGDGKMIDKLPESTFSALGLNGQLVLVDPEHEIVMTRIGGDASPLTALSSGSDPVGSVIVSDLGNALADALKE